MKNVIGLSILLTLSLCLGCYDDKGNYDYHDFNEVTIGNRGFDTAYLLTSYVDTLRSLRSWNSNWKRISI